MPSRKIPSVEQAYELFDADPWRPLSEWAEEWDCSHERVRQLREQAGFDPISKIDKGIAMTVVNRIRNGEYSLTVRELYKDLPIGLEKFLTWMKQEPSIYLAVLEAQQWIEKESWNPPSKQCAKCGNILAPKSFNKTQKYKDGLQKVCKYCMGNPSEKLQKIKEKQKKLQELKNKLDN